MTRNEFFALADRVFDLAATERESATFESSVEAHPDWMELYIDQKGALHGALGAPELSVSPDFDAGVVALWRADRIRHSLHYWAPAAFAAVAAAVGFLALIQVMTSPVRRATFDNPSAEARLGSDGSVDFPSLREPQAR